MKKKQGIDWTKKNLADALGRPDLKSALESNEDDGVYEDINRKDGVYRNIYDDMAECEYACQVVAPYGFVPEAGCPVHD
jgi:hypothetical protein